MGKFINPFTDFGFKHIFGREMDKDILIEFLNDLLEGEYTIMDLRMQKTEQTVTAKTAMLLQFRRGKVNVFFLNYHLLR